MKAPPGVRDTRKLCEFNRDHNHQIDECHALRLEVAKLLKQGHLKDLLTKCGRVNKDKSSNRTKDDSSPIPPRQDRVINVISSRSKVNGALYATSKRSSCHIFWMNLHKTRAHNPKALQIINFCSDESNYNNDLHDNALVISLSIANCLTANWEPQLGKPSCQSIRKE